MAEDIPNRAHSQNDAPGAGIPGSASHQHPQDGIPLPAHGFETLDLPVRELATYPAGEIVSRAAVVLVSAAAEKLGLVPAEEPDLDLPEARYLITALAGLVSASRDGLGAKGDALVEAVRTLQKAFREASAHPDAPGQGPGESLLT